MKFVDRTEYLFKEFAMYFPSLALKAERYYQDGPSTLIVKLNDDTAVWYDDTRHSISAVPKDSSTLDKDEFTFQFTRRLAKLMEDRRMSQRTLAEKLGIDESQVNKYVNGKNIPSLYVADRIAKILNCSLDELRYHD